MANRAERRHRRDAYATCIALLLCASPLASAEHLVYLASGETFPATAVAKIDGDEVHFTTPEGDKTVAAKDFVKWGALRDSAQGTQIILSDGGLIVASDVRIEEEKLVADSNLFGEPEDFKLQGTLRLPLAGIRAVLFRVPIDPLARDQQLAQVWQAEGNADQLLLANGDVIAGTLKRLAPTNGDPPGPMAATMETAPGEVTIAPDTLEGRLADKVGAIIFNPQLVHPPPPALPRLAIGLADGSRLFAEDVSAGDGTANFDEGIRSHPDEDIWSKITSLQAFDSGVKHLAELKASGYKHVPLVGTAWPLGVNENGLGGKLRSGGNLYLRGVGMHAASRVVYALDQPYAKFQAELALDDSAGDEGSVQFIVLSDASGTFKPIYKSAIIRGGDAPTPISLDIAGAKRLALVVEPADHGDVLDRANWLDARLLGERGTLVP